MQYRIHIQNREYTKWNIYENEPNSESLPEIEKRIDPQNARLFTNDIFTISENNISVIHSQIKSGATIAGVLFVDRVYGKTAKKCIYKCIPDDVHLPTFLVPYQPRIEFSKKVQNKYVIFKYTHWDTIHPHGTLLNVLGNIDELPSFYEYQLYCKSLHVSLTEFTNTTRERLHQIEQDHYISQILGNDKYNVCDRRNTHQVFSIDPRGSQDFDDAFSITKQLNITTISIYIANVYMWLETLNLWSSFSDRVATIYLPDKKRPMLPTILSDSLCSLQAGETRFAFTMDIDVCMTDDNTIGQIEEPRFSNTAVIPCNNFVYDHIHNFAPYTDLMEITRKLDAKVADSHDMVAYWMIYMNAKCGKYMAENRIGIFRSVIHYSPEIPVKIENTVSRRVIEQWGNTSGQYVIYKDGLEPVQHQIMKLQSYIHITSPIRRLVDLLNLMQISSHCGIVQLSSGAEDFLSFQLSRIDYINQSMRLIRKIQTDCELIYRCMNTPEVLKKTHRGILFDKTERNDGRFTYMVYLEEVGLLSRIHLYESMENHSYQLFHMFIFENEVKRKIRLQMVDA